MPFHARHVWLALAAMQTLLSVLVTWLAVNFGLPAIHEHPRVELVSTDAMAQVRFQRLAPLRPNQAAVAASPSRAGGPGHEVHAIYDDKSRTIYLRDDWSASKPADMSLLVHELVHHLQNVGGVQYDCAEAREKPAYAAQARWLEFFSKNLADEFELDPMTILVRTNCFN
jgi:hypothetical protein